MNNLYNIIITNKNKSQSNPTNLYYIMNKKIKKKFN